MSSLACIKMGGKMIHNFCYSHLIMINTLCTCTVQYKYEYSTENTVQYKVYHYFLIGSILFGGIKPPPQALMTHRPCSDSCFSIILTCKTQLLNIQIKCIAYQKISIFSKYFQLEAIILKTKSADIDHLVGLTLS